MKPKVAPSFSIQNAIRAAAKHFVMPKLKHHKHFAVEKVKERKNITNRHIVITSRRSSEFILFKKHFESKNIWPWPTRFHLHLEPFVGFWYWDFALWSDRIFFIDINNWHSAKSRDREIFYKFEDIYFIINLNQYIIHLYKLILHKKQTIECRNMYNSAFLSC